MSRGIKGSKLRLRAHDQLNLLAALLLLATGALIIALAADLARLIADAGSARACLQRLGESARSGAALRALLLLAAGCGWIVWYQQRRRLYDQLRLRRSEQKYRNIINHAGEAIFLLDGVGRVLEWNKSAETLFDEPRRNALGRPFRDIHLCYGLEIDRAMADADRLGRSLSFEFPFPRGGRRGAQIQLTISPIAAGADDEGAGRAYVVIARDITSEKQLASRISETEKLAGIGQLAAGIAHQLNTPLGSILLSAQMLEDSVKHDEDHLEDVRRIIRQTEQCRAIIKGLLNFARPSGGERGLVELGEVVRETINLLDKTIKVAGVEVVIEQNAAAQLVGNRNELDQVFFNLLANALDAMPGGGRVTVTIGERQPGELEVVFADTGEGIAPQHQDQVFLPFFTTKEYGKGTGLGLSIVARIVHEHGGRIELRSRPGEGTRFQLVLPQARSAAPPPR